MHIRCTSICTQNALQIQLAKMRIFDFFFIGASEIKSWEKSRIFRYGLPEDFLSKGQKPQGGTYSAPSHHGLEG